ncbi:MAG: DMT family transporter [Pseudomonadota bacterium]
MTDPAKSTLRGALFALLAFAIFATADTLVKYLGGFYAPFQILFFSVTLSFPLVLFMLIGDPEKATLRPVHPYWTAFRTLAVILTGATAFYAFATIPLAQVYAILFAAPLIITILSIPILGERVGPHRWAAVALGLVGVLIVVRPGTSELTLGHFAAISAAVTSSFASIIVRKIGRDERTPVMMLYPMLANFIAMGALMPRFYDPMPVEHLGLLALFSFLAFTAGLLLIAAYRMADAAIVAPMQYSQILWAAGYGWFLFGETADRTTWVGAGVVIISGLYIVLRESLAGISETTPVLRTKSRPETGTAPRVSTIEKMQPPGG